MPTHFYQERSKGNCFGVLAHKKNCLKIIFSVKTEQSILKAANLEALYQATFKKIVLAKVKKIFICANCGATSPKWMGRCQNCGEWNTIQEEVIVQETAPEERSRMWRGAAGKNAEAKPVLLPDVQTGNTHRLVTPDAELNRVLGGGIVSGSLVLLGGSPALASPP